MKRNQTRLKKKVTKIISLWLPPILWMGIIFFLSSRPTIKTTQIYWQDFLIKKTAHFVEYAILSFLYIRAFLGSSMSQKKSFILAFLISLVYAISDEYHQSFVPGREPRIRDVVIDSMGALFAIYLVAFRPSWARKLVGKLIPYKVLGELKSKN